MTLDKWLATPMGQVLLVASPVGLDGDFGPPRVPPPLPGTTQAPLPNWDRVVYLVGVNRQPIGWVWGWRHSIPLRDPGP